MLAVRLLQHCGGLALPRSGSSRPFAFSRLSPSPLPVTAFHCLSSILPCWLAASDYVRKNTSYSWGIPFHSQRRPLSTLPSRTAVPSRRLQSGGLGDDMTRSSSDGSSIQHSKGKKENTDVQIASLKDHTSICLVMRLGSMYVSPSFVIYAAPTKRIRKIRERAETTESEERKEQLQDDPEILLNVAAATTWSQTSPPPSPSSSPSSSPSTTLSAPLSGYVASDLSLPLQSSASAPLKSKPPPRWVLERRARFHARARQHAIKEMKADIRRCVMCTKKDFGKKATVRNRARRRILPWLNKFLGEHYRVPCQGPYLGARDGGGGFSTGLKKVDIVIRCKPPILITSTEGLKDELKNALYSLGLFQVVAQSSSLEWKAVEGDGNELGSSSEGSLLTALQDASQDLVLMTPALDAWNVPESDQPQASVGSGPGSGGRCAEDQTRTMPLFLQSHMRTGVVSKEEHIPEGDLRTYRSSLAYVHAMYSHFAPPLSALGDDSPGSISATLSAQESQHSTNKDSPASKQVRDRLTGLLMVRNQLEHLYAMLFSNRHFYDIVFSDGRPREVKRRNETAALQKLPFHCTHNVVRRLIRVLIDCNQLALLQEIVPLFRAVMLNPYAVPFTASASAYERNLSISLAVKEVRVNASTKATGVGSAV